MIRHATEDDFNDIYDIINDAAIAYKGIIPADRWNEPYMGEQELQQQIHDGVNFICYEDQERVVGVMGIQDKIDVQLIRHAYVRTNQRRKGIGAKLIRHLIKESKKPTLIGTWQAASWAIKFYENHGFKLVSEQEKNMLLNKYWVIPQRQVDTSVVLVDKLYTAI